MNRKRCALSHCTFDRNLPAMRLDQLARDRQAQPAADAFAMGARAVAAPEAIKEKRQIVRRNPFTCITNTDVDKVALARSGQRDLAAGWCMA